MNLYIVSTPFHLMITILNKKLDDKIVVIDAFNLSRSAFSCHLLQENFPEENILVLKSAKQFKKRLYLLPFYVKKIKELIRVQMDDYFEEIYVFNDVDPICQVILSAVKSKNEIILIEEGIGLYRDIIKQNKWLYTMFGKVIFGHNFENIERIGELSKVTTIACNYPNHLSTNQLQKKIINFPCIEIAALNAIYNKDVIKDKSFDLFIGQPLTEDNVLEDEFYINVIENILINLPDNRLLVIKPHPRENLEKYRKLSENKYILLNEQDIPVEVILSNKRNVNIYTIYSSAALNISRYLNFEVFMLYKILDLEINIPSEFFQNAGVKIVSSYDEIFENK